MLSYHHFDLQPEPLYQEQTILAHSDKLDDVSVELHSIRVRQANLRLDYYAYHHKVHALQRIMWKIQSQTAPFVPPQPPELTPVMIAIKVSPDIGESNTRHDYTYIVTYQSLSGQKKAEMGAEMQRVRDELEQLEVKRKVLVEERKRGDKVNTTRMSVLELRRDSLTLMANSE